MKGWPASELRDIAASDDLHISPLREDGVTYGTPTWIWSVVINEAVYVRGYNGTKSRWYKAAVQQKAGRIRAAGISQEVSFAAMDDESLNRRIDDAYCAKYPSSAYLPAMISARARAATVKVMPLAAP